MSDNPWADEVKKLQKDSAKARAALEKALDAETTKRVECQCGRKFNTTVTDHTNAVRAADIWFRQGAELAKHLERLQPKTPSVEERPFRDVSTEDLRLMQREHAEGVEGSDRINARLKLYEAVEAVLAGENTDQLRDAWHAYRDSDPFPSIEPVTTPLNSGLRDTHVRDRVYGQLTASQLAALGTARVTAG